MRIIAFSAGMYIAWSTVCGDAGCYSITIVRGGIARDGAADIVVWPIAGNIRDSAGNRGPR